MKLELIGALLLGILGVCFPKLFKEINSESVGKSMPKFHIIVTRILGGIFIIVSLWCIIFDMN